MADGAGSMWGTEVAFLLQSVLPREEVCRKMCRLMGYVSSSPESFGEVVGENLQEFIELSSVHCDGWGITTLNRGDDIARLVKAPEIARSSDNFKSTLNNTNADGALMHFRWATSGLPVSEENTHPFTHGGYTFIHNGAIYPPAALDGLINNKYKPFIKGDTDSERYFYFLLTEIDSYGLVDGSISAIKKLRQFDFSSVNAMLMNGNEFVTICEHDPKRKPDWATDGYYDLYYKVSQRNGGSEVVVASSGWDQTGWTNLPNHSILIADRAALTVKVLTV